MADKILLTPVEAAKLLGIGRTKVYDLMRRGDLFSVRLDGCRRIPRTALEAFVATLGVTRSTDATDGLPRALDSA